MTRPSRPAIDRLMDKVVFEPMSGCWLFTGSLSENGYGRVGIGKAIAPALAHRVTYEARFGAIPAGLVIDHLCRVRCCVNPDHLEAVTTRENLLRGVGPTFAAHLADMCKHGHSLLDAYRQRDGRRVCKPCCLERNARRRAARKAAA